uniref:Protein kinase domain-containing protein n=1 Tax=Phytophthora ramorum TaxID=164328 RepID=H3G5T0_PHYRM
RVRQEVSVLSRLRAHPNIMRFVEVFETPTRIHAVTELVQGASLCDILRRAPGQRLTETRAKLVFRQLTAAVEVLHAQCVIHRDLKLENVLLDENSGHATVIDFGFSDFEEIIEPQATHPADNNPPKKQLKKKNFCGTPSYMAPEVVASERYDGRPVDVWSLGVLLYVMLCGKFPF